MKLILTIALSSLVSVSAFASPDPVPAPAPAPAPVRFECKLHDMSKKGSHCEVRGAFLIHDGITTMEADELMPERRVDAALAVRCNNGFEIRDEKADAKLEREALIIRGDEDRDHDRDRKDRKFAVLELRERDVTFAEERRDDDLRGSLFISTGERFRGECEVRRGVE